MRELPGLVGRRLGPSEPVLVDQERIDAFAECTVDPQWIHVDPERAATGPFGATIAHGFLTLSLLSHVFDELLEVEDAGMGLNYGLDRVRFPAPVLSGSLVSAVLEPLTVDPGPEHTMMTARVTFTAAGAARPCCVADSVTRFVERAA
jgi:acyl dehydratase